MIKKTIEKNFSKIKSLENRKSTLSQKRGQNFENIKNFKNIKYSYSLMRDKK